MKDYEVVKVEKPEDRLEDVNRRLKRNLVFSVATLALASVVFGVSATQSIAVTPAAGMLAGSMSVLVSNLIEKSQIKKEIKENNQKVM